MLGASLGKTHSSGFHQGDIRKGEEQQLWNPANKVLTVFPDLPP